MSGTSRRSAILESAVAEFADHGYHGARLERIAAAAHANKQLIFHYFESKNGLYEAVVSGLFASSAITEGRGATPLESLKEHLSRIADWLEANPGASRALAECARGTGIPTVACRAAEGWLELQSSALRGAIEDGQRKGFFRDDVDAQTIAVVALGSLVGQQFLAGSGGGSGAALAATTLGRIVADYCAWR